MVAYTHFVFYRHTDPNYFYQIRCMNHQTLFMVRILYQSCYIVNWPLRNILQWNFNKMWIISSFFNISENAVCSKIPCSECIRRWFSAVRKQWSYIFLALTHRNSLTRKDSTMVWAPIHVVIGVQSVTAGGSWGSLAFIHWQLLLWQNITIEELPTPPRSFFWYPS